MDDDDELDALVDIDPSAPRPGSMGGTEMEKTPSMHRSVSVAEAMSTNEWDDFYWMAEILSGAGCASRECQYVFWDSVERNRAGFVNRRTI
jgi:hypothetical protein